jgi:hypothetical protein
MIVVQPESKYGKERHNPVIMLYFNTLFNISLFYTVSGKSVNVSGLHAVKFADTLFQIPFPDRAPSDEA